MARARITKAAQRAAGVAERKATKVARTNDAFQNFALNLGLGTDQPLSLSTYGFNPITRNRTLLEWIHRGSWLGGQAVDIPAEDMTRAGIEITSEVQPDAVEKIDQAAIRFGVWGALRDNVSWSRLYGGCIAAIMIDGQDPSTPLRTRTVGRGQFRGLYVMDRWMVDPSLNDLVTEPGPDFGLPKFYTVISTAPAMVRARFHHSRVIRLEGVRLPYWQRVSENLWGISVIERMYDRMVAYDSATTGAAQLANKSYIRTYKVDGLRSILAAGGKGEQVLVSMVQLMRRMQGIEGVTLIDMKDELAAMQANGMTGMSEIVGVLAEQVSGALQIPLSRLGVQPPGGLNGAADSDLRMYYEGILSKQERDLWVGVHKVYTVMALGEGIDLGDQWNFTFNPLLQMTDTDQSQVDQRDTETVLSAEEQGIIDPPTALKELRQRGKQTGRWSNITDDMIKQAEAMANMPPLPGLDGLLGGGPDAGFGAPSTGGAAGPASSGGPAASHMTQPGAQRRVRVSGGKATEHTSFGDALTPLPTGDFGGLAIAIEHPTGTVRWTGAKPLTASYGYIRRVPSAEGPQEWMDCFVGANRESQKVWVADAYQRGEFDEHKVMLGFDSENAVRGAWAACYDGGPMHLGYLTETTLGGLRAWLRRGAVDRPYRDQHETAMRTAPTVRVA